MWSVFKSINRRSSQRRVQFTRKKERLEALCKFKGYKIYDYYTDAGISAKTGNHRPEFDRLIDDAKAGKINTVIALKLDRLSRSIYDWENLLKTSEKYGFDLVVLMMI